MHHHAAIVVQQASGTSWAEWLTAIGTILAVVVALGLQGFLWWRERRRRPLLSLTFDSHYFTTEAAADGSALPYVRLAVSNARGRHSATDTRILVIRVDEIGGGGVKRWLANPALAWANSEPFTAIEEVPAGATRYVDLGLWSHAIPPIEFTLAVKPEPNTGIHRLPPGEYEIELAATMANGDASAWIAVFSFGEQVASGLGEPVNVQATIRAA